MGNEPTIVRVDLLEEGIAKIDASPRHESRPGLYSYLGVAKARSGDIDRARSRPI